MRCIVKRLKRRLGGFFLAIVLLAFSLRVGAKAEIVYRSAAKTERMRVALTFDDGPHPRYTPQILDILSENGVHATFFTVGSNADSYPALIRRIRAEGHELGNHTYHHHRVGKLDAATLQQEISSCRDTVFAITGVRPLYFRPPEGVCSCDVEEICDELDMTIVLWSVDTRDWAHTPIPEICENVRRNTRNGSIILMHDFIGKNSPTPEALRQIIPMLRELGFEFVTVSQLLAEE